jgi:hypothetical protein
VRSGDIIRAIEICEPISPPGKNAEETGISAFGDTDRRLRYPGYRRRIVPVPPRGVSDAEWERMARSCESALEETGDEDRKGDTVIVVERIENADN